MPNKEFSPAVRKRPLAVVTGDWHLKHGDRIWKYRKEPQGDCWYAMTQVARVVNNISPKYLFLLGDIFHTPINTSDVFSRFRDFLRLLEVPVRIYYLQGQHDMANPPWLDLIRGEAGCPIPSRIYGRLCDEEFDLVFWGLDYTSDAQAAFNAILEATAGRIDILLTHQAWKEAIGFGGGNASFEDLKKLSCLKLAISGDLHKPVSFNIRRDESQEFSPSDMQDNYQQSSNDYQHGDNLELLFPGSICITDLNTRPPFSCIVLYEDLSYVRYELRGRVFVSGRVCNKAQFDAFVAENPLHILLDDSLPEKIRKPIVYLRGDPKLLLQGKEIYGKDTYYIMSVMQENTSVSSSMIRVTGSDVRTQMLNYLMQKYPKYADAFRHFLFAIVDGADSKAAISRAISEVTGAVSEEKEI